MKTQTVNQARAKALVKAGGKIIDVRTPVEFRDSKIEGSLNMSLRQVTQLQTYPRDVPILIRGTDQTTVDSAIRYATLYGFKTVFRLPEDQVW